MFWWVALAISLTELLRKPAPLRVLIAFDWENDVISK
jgi:hypothetical protein